MNLTRLLYRAARLSNDARAVSRTVKTGDPQYVARRAKNKTLGRLLRPIWRMIWR